MFNYMSFFKVIVIMNMYLPCAKHCIGHYLYVLLFNFLQQPCKERSICNPTLQIDKLSLIKETA